MICTPKSKSNTLETLGALALYALLLVGSIYLLNGHPADWSLRVPIALLPALGAMPLLPIMIRNFRRVDELQRRIQFEAIVFAFAATAVTTFTYGFLEGVGFPHLNWTYVWVVMASFWAIGRAIAARRYR